MTARRQLEQIIKYGSVNFEEFLYVAHPLAPWHVTLGFFTTKYNHDCIIVCFTIDKVYVNGRHLLFHQKKCVICTTVTKSNQLTDY